MTVVPMAERLLAALAEIEKACFHAPWSESMLREELGKGLFLVAERDGQAVGYVGCQTVLDEGYITNVAVSPDCRRQGVASALIRALEQDVAAHGYTRAILETARTTDDSAALYHKLGYREIAYYGSPAGAENCRCFEKMLAVEESRT